MGTIAVTGATGYLAEKLIERLITQGHTIQRTKNISLNSFQRMFFCQNDIFKRSQMKYPITTIQCLFQ